MNVEHIIFDLDNTLYSSTTALDAGITNRMMGAVADFFGVDIERAKMLRNQNLPRFGTTLEWLRSEGLADIEKYFAQVHPANEADELPPDENLRPLLISIPQNKIILTNAPREHADRVLQKLNVADLFEDVVDIRACGLKGKPYENSYRLALEKIGGTIENTIFIDDLLKYTNGFTALGGTAVLVGEKNLQVDTAKDFQSTNLFKINSIYFLPDLLNKLKEM